ncbi:MAG TPA: DUF2169 domain-containing protein, partial [Acetobacteraceae bacterium]|nr:DUF2169 domain-containing protein [Acetobacteraceae bacterium]
LGLALEGVAPGVRVRLARLAPEPMLTFTLPERWPRIALDTGRGPEELPVALHTVGLQVEERRADLIWRAAKPYPGTAWLTRLTRLHAEAD